MTNSRRNEGSQKKRTLIALASFTAVLCIIFAFAANYMGSEESIKETTKTEQISNNTFYKTIGQAPINIKTNDASEEAKVLDQFTLEFKVANTRYEAEKLIDLLSGMGIRAYFTPLSRKGKIVYRVRHGMYPSLKQAKNRSYAIRTQKNVATKIIKLQ